MSAKNAVLLVVKQNNGIEYNELLNKFSSSYSNMNSARAALSRTLKDLGAFGFVARRGSRFFVLGKGELEIYSEIKNKLVLSLNSSMRQKQPETDIDSIVARLQVLIERGRQDKDLLRTSRSSLDFFVSDLERVKSELDAKAAHLSYLSGVFSGQIRSMKELDFYDAVSLETTPDSVSRLEMLFSGLPEGEFAVECALEEVARSLSWEMKLRHRNASFVLPKKMLKRFFSLMLENKRVFFNEKITVFSSTFRLVFFLGKVFFSGPFSEVEGWRAANPREK